jgi:hypothetical protein
VDSALPCPTGPTASRLSAGYVTNLAVNLEYGDFMGAPPIYGINITDLPAERWKVEVEFLGTPDGLITFECNELALMLDAP